MDWTIADYIKMGGITTMIMTAIAAAKKDGVPVWWCMNPKLVEAFMRGEGV